MKTPIIDGQSIEQFIPANLRDMFYRHPMPQYKYSIKNGLDPYGFSTDGLVLYLPLWALKDSAFKSVDAYGHTCTVTEALWTPTGRTFDGNNDIIDCGTALSFGTNPFTIIVWAGSDDAAAAKAMVGNANATSTEGFWLGLDPDNIYYYNYGTSQLISEGGDYNDGGWYQFALVRNGTVNNAIYVNAVSKTIVGNTDNFGDLADTGNTLYIGAKRPTDRHWHDNIGEVLIYNRALSAGEIAHIYNSTAWRYQ